jgi:hypothetical protein
VLFAQCGKEEEADISTLKVGDNEYIIRNATIYDYGTDSDITYRTYKLRFQTGDTNPKAYLEFRIYSNSTKRLEEGVYPYSYDAEKGKISYTEIGINLKYDDKGEATEGTRVDESSDDTGTLTITKADNGNYVFDIDLVMHKDKAEYIVKAHINEALEEY